MTSFRIDTTPLDHEQGWWRLENATKIPSPSLSRTSLIETAFMDSAIPVRGGAEVGHVNLSIWVANAPHTRSFEILQERTSTLGALFDTAQTLTHTSNTGDVRSIQVLSCEIGEINRVGTAGGILPVTLTVAPYWQSGDTLTATRTLAAGTKVLTEFNGVTGAIVDGVVTLAGAGTNVKLTAPNGTGVVVPSLVAGKPVVINLAAHTVTQGGKPSEYDYPAGGFLRLEPVVNHGVAQVKVMVTGSNLSGEMKIEGKKWYR